ncbi:MAG: hypothetical protein MUE60_10300, partial [Candidatus Eisenbacteria bacterium]|nr:hypothetical protein [Candidatus Eisenbacteria bacterium]
MRLTATIALMIAVLAGAITSSDAETKPLFGKIHGRVYADGNVVAKAIVEFVIMADTGEEFHART